MFGAEDNCPKPEYDEEQHCYCGKGRKMSGLEASYNRDREDRTYTFSCTGIPGNVGGFSGDSW